MDRRTDRRWTDRIAILISRVSVLTSSFFFFQSVLRWSVAVSTICRHSSSMQSRGQSSEGQGLPKLHGAKCRQVFLLLASSRAVPVGYTLQPARARWWSSRCELRAVWPKSRRRLLVTRRESGEQPVVLLTFGFDTWRVQGILKISHSAHVSKASRRESRYFVLAQVSHPYIKTGTMYV